MFLDLTEGNLGAAVHNQNWIIGKPSLIFDSDILLFYTKFDSHIKFAELQ